MPVPVLLIPRWGGRPESDWYPWLVDALAEDEALGPVTVARMPAPDAPTHEAWVPAIARHAGDDPDVLARTVLVGHSVACLAVAHYLAALPAPRHVRGFLGVAAWWYVDAPWDSLRPWMARLPDVARARRACPRAAVLLSDNDPFTADAAENGRWWAEGLGAAVEVVPGAGHFNRRAAPRVRDALHRHFDPPPA